MTVFQGRKRRGNIRGKRGRGGGPGIGFNLLWLEFQNTRWLMHIAFGSVPTSLCGRTSATFPSIPPLPLISRSRRPSPPPLSLSPSSNGRKLILSSHQATAHNSPYSPLLPSPPPFFWVIRFKRYLCRVNRTAMCPLHVCHPTDGVRDGGTRISSRRRYRSRKSVVRDEIPPKWITCSRLLHPEDLARGFGELQPIWIVAHIFQACDLSKLGTTTRVIGHSDYGGSICAPF